jgi:hypothetical protein
LAQRIHDYKVERFKRKHEAAQRRSVRKITPKRKDFVMNIGPKKTWVTKLKEKFAKKNKSDKYVELR